MSLFIIINFLYVYSFKYHSDDDVSSVTSGSNPSASGTQSSPRPHTQGGGSMNYTLPPTSHDPGRISGSRAGSRVGSRGGSQVCDSSDPPLHPSHSTHIGIDPLLRSLEEQETRNDLLHISIDTLKVRMGSSLFNDYNYYPLFTQVSKICFTHLFQRQVEKDYSFYKQSLDEERFRYERLEEQINDFTELHQHEVTNIKQVSIVT